MNEAEGFSCCPYKGASKCKSSKDMEQSDLQIKRDIWIILPDWVQHYNHERYHESLDNVTPSDVDQGRRDDILDQRAIIKSRTMMRRKVQNLRLAG